MIAWQKNQAGLLVPAVYVKGKRVEPPAATCPPHIRAKLAALRAEFAQRAGIK